MEAQAFWSARQHLGFSQRVFRSRPNQDHRNLKKTIDVTNPMARFLPRAPIRYRNGRTATKPVLQLASVPNLDLREVSRSATVKGTLSATGKGHL